MQTRGATRRTLAAVACGGVLACGGGPAPDAPAATSDGTSPFHILVTNDDGIESPGIRELAAALRAVGEVTVVAPCGQQSGTSMSIRLNQEIRLRTSEAGHCVDATPAGAVLLAYRALQPASGFDLVVSGINIGANIGEVSHMSGTIGAAMMGAYLGVPAVAASLGGRPSGVEYPAGVVARFVAELRRRGPESGVVYSVNFPAGTAEETLGIAARPMGGSYFRVDYEEVTGAEGDVGTGGAEDDRLFRPAFGPPDPIPAGSDTEAHNAGLVTITPLRFDWTDRPTVGELEGWDLEALLGDEGDGG
ncbi:5'/3'-nucleotidase SurE [Candidatus Palauibacter sp.]|uniref:5'/3'-nucleotidase SurE n=1 Tax=Candidatus Palauibacter sp. TaxID=3101350 RepID=UPI003B5A642C